MPVEPNQTLDAVPLPGQAKVARVVPVQPLPQRKVRGAVFPPAMERKRVELSPRPGRLICSASVSLEPSLQKLLESAVPLC